MTNSEGYARMDKGLCRAVRYMHGQDPLVIHGDLKPSCRGPFCFSFVPGAKAVAPLSRRRCEETSVDAILRSVVLSLSGVSAISAGDDVE